MTGPLWQFVVAVAVLSAALVGLVRRLAVAHGVIDHPTNRSSHVTPTARGGGLGVIAAIVAACLSVDGTPHDARLLATLAAAIAVASVGWFDDRRGMPVRTRLLVHL